MRQVGKEEGGARGKQKGVLKATVLRSNGLVSLTLESSKERQEKCSGYTNVNEQECEKQIFRRYKRCSRKHFAASFQTNLSFFPPSLSFL